MTRPRLNTEPALVTVDGRLLTPAQLDTVMGAWLADHGGPAGQPRGGHRGNPPPGMPAGWTTAYLHLIEQAEPCAADVLQVAVQQIRATCSLDGDTFDTDDGQTIHRGRD